MDIDWVVGIMIFILFTGWSFAYYSGLFGGEGEDPSGTLAMERDKIINSFSVYAYRAHVIYESRDPENDSVLKAKSVWYHGEKNSTRVYSSGGTLVPCRISGDDLYWEADVSTGENGFTIQIADVNESRNCTASFSVSSSNLTYPWAFEKRSMVSLHLVNEMALSEYDYFRSLHDINQDFRVTLEYGGNSTVYGKSPPSGPVDIISWEREMKVIESQDMANITVAVW